jgi:hypothetical protein
LLAKRALFFLFGVLLATPVQDYAIYALLSCHIIPYLSQPSWHLKGESMYFENSASYFTVYTKWSASLVIKSDHRYISTCCLRANAILISLASNQARLAMAMATPTPTHRRAISRVSGSFVYIMTLITRHRCAEHESADKDKSSLCLMSYFTPKISILGI